MTFDRHFQRDGLVRLPIRNFKLLPAGDRVEVVFGPVSGRARRKAPYLWVT